MFGRITILVFPWLHGSLWHPKRLSAAFFRRIKQFGINVSFHGLRHSYASILLRAGTPLKVASEALGHCSVAITAELYTHVLGELQRDAADRLCSVFDAASRKKSARHLALLASFVLKAEHERYT